ncbi:MAG: hypothetical protein ACLFPX_08395 [Candidatus Omnitrophota bacterium]
MVLYFACFAFLQKFSGEVAEWLNATVLTRAAPRALSPQGEGKPSYH